LNDNSSLEHWWREKGAIYITTDGSSIPVNHTLPTHFFHQGDVTRRIIDGYIYTEGQGTNSSKAVAALNQYVGPITFEANDAFMLTFSTLDQLSGGFLLYLIDPLQ